ncbi:MAG: LTA synthase family protein [Marinifilaceae bacterium]
MRSKLLFLFKTYIFWMCLSIMARVLFLFYQSEQTSLLQRSEVYMIFRKGLRMDLSLGAYIMLLFSVLMIASIWLKPRIMRYVYMVLTVVLLLFFCSVTTVNLELFSNWGFHMDTTPLSYIKTPAAAMASTPISLAIALFVLMLTSVGGAFYLYKHWIIDSLYYKERNYKEAIVYLLLGGLMFLPIRGGFNVAPMNSSFVYFHPTNIYANQCAVNPVWNFIYELSHIKKQKNNFRFMEHDIASTLLSQSIKTCPNSQAIINSQRPNIVFLLLESFTANAIESLGGQRGITPNLDQLAQEGVLFTNIYATAGRSDRGLVAAISAIPSHPDIAIIKYPAKTMSYPSLPKDLEKEGYNTHFYYAGDLNFGSFRSYTTMRFQNIITENDFNGEAIKNRFKWGVHDEYMFDRLFDDIKQSQSPSLFMAFNMSSHEPFDVPMEPVILGDSRESKFLNAIHYSDKCLGNFIEKCKESGIWDNTLFVLMADHGTRHIGNLEPTSPLMYKIPLIFTGGVISQPGTKIERIGSQTDMVATLLGQLGLNYSNYMFSKNLLSNQPGAEFAFYSYSDAACAVTPKGTMNYNIKSKEFVTDTTDMPVDLFKAYLQRIDEITK